MALCSCTLNNQRIGLTFPRDRSGQEFAHPASLLAPGVFVMALNLVTSTGEPHAPPCTTVPVCCDSLACARFPYPLPARGVAVVTGGA